MTIVDDSLEALHKQVKEEIEGMETPSKPKKQSWLPWSGYAAGTDNFDESGCEKAILYGIL